MKSTGGGNDKDAFDSRKRIVAKILDNRFAYYYIKGMEKTFRRVPDGRSGSMLAYLDGITVGELRAVLGLPNRDSYRDDEAGYDGIEYNFVDQDGNALSIYTRFGKPRISGNGGMDDAIVFVAWLQANGFPKAKVDQLDMDSYLASLRTHLEINALMNTDS